MAVDPIRGAGDPQTRGAGTQTHALYEAHSHMVYGLCRALLRDPDDADDATQATFISAYRSLLGGNEVREPAAWLATIARNECTARAQARMREPLPLLEADLRQAPGPEEELERRAVIDDLQQAIAGLPEKQREAVVLRDLYGLRYTEVGAALGMSVASVESLLFRARRSLRISLKPLAGGALTVPIAVREGIAQALPGFAAARAAGGGAASGAVGLGLLAKLSGGPAALKAAAGVAAAVAAGSIAVAEVEQPESRRPSHAEHGAQPRSAGPGDSQVAAAAASFTTTPADTADGNTRAGREGRSGRADDERRGGPSGGKGAEGSDDAGPAEHDRSDDDRSGGARADDGENVREPDHSNDAGDHGGETGSAGSRTDDDEADDSEPHEDVLSVEASRSGSESDDAEDVDDSEDTGHSGKSEDSGEDEHDQGEPDDADDEDESGHGSDDESGDDPAPAPA